MTAVYPNSLPTKDPAGTYLSSNPHSSLHDNMYDEIVAICTELGTNPSGGTDWDTVNNRVGAYEEDWVDITSEAVRLDQGTASNISNTINYQAYRRILDDSASMDGGIEWIIDMTCNGTGASGYIEVYTPATFSISGPMGRCQVYDSSAARMYRGFAYNSGSGWAWMYFDTGYIGSGSPAFQLASGDRIVIMLDGGSAWF